MWLGHRIEVSADQTFAGEVNRVEPPADHDLIGIGHCGVGFSQPGDHLVDALATGPHAAGWIASVEEADVDVLPRAAGHHMAVGLDESRREHMVSEGVVDAMVTPAREFIERTDTEDAVAADSDGFSTR
ncbi:MAG: hypothetical protein EBY49_05025 [Actinobacteria bacterium]|nr:hypothetical protein [Actinomycetota bacterium]